MKAETVTSLYKITKHLSSGSIILLHDTQKVTVETLPHIIKYCRINNIKIVSLPELIEQEPYEHS